MSLMDELSREILEDVDTVRRLVDILPSRIVPDRCLLDAEPDGAWESLVEE